MTNFKVVTLVSEVYVSVLVLSIILAWQTDLVLFHFCLLAVPTLSVLVHALEKPNFLKVNVSYHDFDKEWC